MGAQDEVEMSSMRIIPSKIAEKSEKAQPKLRTLKDSFRYEDEQAMDNMK
jgi:hypothetical protein